MRRTARRTEIAGYLSEETTKREPCQLNDKVIDDAGNDDSYGQS